MKETTRTPFLSRAEFEAKKTAGEIQPDVLFPIMNYDFCKYVWEHSPLIAHLDAVTQEYIKENAK